MKRYIIRKYIIANSAQDAIKKERQAPAEDVWVDDEWKAQEGNEIGFKIK